MKRPINSEISYFFKKRPILSFFEPLCEVWPVSRLQYEIDAYVLVFQWKDEYEDYLLKMKAKL